MDLSDASRDRIAGRLAEIACAAGAVLRRYEIDGCDHRLKDDGSPTSAADLAAEELIIEALAGAFPGIPVVAEETASAVAPAELFFLVDPMDGTRDFLHGTGEYSVNIALVAGRRPVAAALAAPALGRVWAAGRTARAGRIVGEAPDTLVPVQVRAAPARGITALVSRRHGDDATEACLAGLSVAERRTAGSALKFALIASGEADLYVRCGPTMEWDTAAGDHVLTCAGGLVAGADGGVPSYGHHARGYRNGAFAAMGDPSLAASLRFGAAAA
jgi:3'(2'), 5'-bisphosphate nucleotidase